MNNLTHSDPYSQYILSKHNKKYLLTIVYDNDCGFNPREDQSNLCKMILWHKRYNIGDKHNFNSREELFFELANKYCKYEEIVKTAGQIGIKYKYNPESKFYEAYNENELYNGEHWEPYFEMFTKKEKESLKGKSEIKEILINKLSINILSDLLYKYVQISPVWGYDHGSLTIKAGTRTYPYSDQWDSGLLGYIYIEKETVIKETRICITNKKGERIKEIYHHENMPDTFDYKTKPVTNNTWHKQAQKIIEEETKGYDNYLQGEIFGYVLEGILNPEENEEDWEFEEEDSCYGYITDNPKEIVESEFSTYKIEKEI